MAAPRTIITDYNSLIAALRLRIDELAIPHTLIDDLAGFSAGLTGKITGPSATKTLGMNGLWIMLEVLGLQVVVEDSPAALARMADLYEARKRNSVGRKPLSRHTVGRYARVFARAGGRARASTLTPEERTAFARTAAIARAAKLTPEQRRESARHAARTRWANKMRADPPARIPNQPRCP